jgi:hypothetical protein
MRTLLWMALIVPTIAAAQARDQEIRLARSAAPADVSKDAKVYVLDHDHYIVADPGHSTESCLVARPMLQAFAPMCGDPEADGTILAVERFRSIEVLAGKSPDVIKQEIAAGFKSGRFHAPKRPALIFMMSSAQLLPNPDFTKIGKFQPHLMVFYPGMHNADYGLVNSNDNNVPGVIEEDSPMSAMIVVMHDWVDPAPTQ